MSYEYIENNQTVIIEKDEDSSSGWNMDLLNMTDEGVTIEFPNLITLQSFIHKACYSKTKLETKFSIIKVTHTRTKIILVAEEIKPKGDTPDYDEDIVIEKVFVFDHNQFQEFLLSVGRKIAVILHAKKHP